MNKEIYNKMYALLESKEYDKKTVLVGVAGIVSVPVYKDGEYIKEVIFNVDKDDPLSKSQLKFIENYCKEKNYKFRKFS